MLPEQERHALREIENELRSSDPGFAAALSRHRVGGDAWRWLALLILADVTAALTLLIGVLAQRPDLVLWGMLGATALVAVHLVRTTSSTSDTPV